MVPDRFAAAASDVDVHISGRLINIDVSSDGVDRRVQNFILRDYGVLECRDIGVSLIVRGARLDVNRADKTFRITERREGLTGTAFTILLAVEDGVDFDAWAAALQELSATSLTSEFCLDPSDVISRGQNAVFFAGTREADGAPVITKIIPRRTATAEVATVETRVVDRLKLITPQQYPRNLVRCIDVLQTRNETHVVVERLTGPTLESVIEKNGRMPDSTAYAVFLQILDAVRFLHSVGIVHGAVATRNILIDGPLNCSQVNVKLIGFNAASTKFEDSSRYYEPRREISEYIRTYNEDGLEHLAPEVWMDRRPNPEMDFWGLGCMLYRMLVGRLPFRVDDPGCWRDDYLGADDASVDSYRRYIRLRRPDLRQNFLFPNDHSGVQALSPDARSLLFLLLAPDPLERMSSARITRHPWVCLPRSETVPNEITESPQ